MELVVFIITAAIAVIGALAMLLSKNAVHSALFLLLNFSAIGVLYLLLRAPFLFAVQMIVYAGAIIVLFLFVVMLLGAERTEDTTDDLAWQRPLAIVMGVALLGMALFVFFTQLQQGGGTQIGGNESLGDPDRVGAALFSSYLLPFELTSVVLLTAVIGVVVLASRTEQREAPRSSLSEREPATGKESKLTGRV